MMHKNFNQLLIFIVIKYISHEEKCSLYLGLSSHGRFFFSVPCSLLQILLSYYYFLFYRWIDFLTSLHKELMTWKLMKVKHFFFPDCVNNRWLGGKKKRFKEKRRGTPDDFTRGENNHSTLRILMKSQ